MTINTDANINRNGLSAILLYPEDRLKELRNSALEHILSLTVFHEDGTALVRASDGSDNPEYVYAWFRDNTRIMSGLMSARIYDLADRIWHGMFKVLLKYEFIMDEVIGDPKSYSNDHCLPPRVDPISLGSSMYGWTNQQEPQWLSEFLVLSENRIQYLFKIDDARAPDYLRLYRKSVDYLMAIGSFDNKFSNAWEQLPLDIYTSNIAATLIGFNSAQRFLGSVVPQRILSHGQELLEQRLAPLRESDDRRYDMTLFWLSHPYNLFTQEIRNSIVKQLIEYIGSNGEQPLSHGLPRYFGDVYYGLDDYQQCTRPPFSVPEAQWTKGFTLLAKHYASSAEALHAKGFASSRELEVGYAFLIERAVNVRVNGKSVELYVSNGNGTFTPRNPLAWADVQLLEALK